MSLYTSAVEEIEALQRALEDVTAERDSALKRMWESGKAADAAEARLAAVIAEANRLSDAVSETPEDCDCPHCGFDRGTRHAAERLRDKAAGL